MYALYASYFDATSTELFNNDLLDKDFVFLLHNRQQSLKGFSTVAQINFQYEQNPYRALFSGDTIIDFDYWGGQSLAIAWIQFAAQIKYQQPSIPLYWFLIVKGHRTYRYLPAFCRDYYPNHSNSTPQLEQSLIDTLATQRFGSNYQKNQGVLSFKQSPGYLKSAWAGVSEQDMGKPEVKYFIQRNPGYTNGDELVCIAELEMNNLRPYARRIFQRVGGQ